VSSSPRNGHRICRHRARPPSYHVLGLLVFRMIPIAGNDLTGDHHHHESRCHGSFQVTSSTVAPSFSKDRADRNLFRSTPSFPPPNQNEPHRCGWFALGWCLFAATAIIIGIMADWISKQVATNNQPKVTIKNANDRRHARLSSTPNPFSAPRMMLCGFRKTWAGRHCHPTTNRPTPSFSRAFPAILALAAKIASPFRFAFLFQKRQCCPDPQSGTFGKPRRSRASTAHKKGLVRPSSLLPSSSFRPFSGINAPRTPHTKTRRDEYKE
jgi:hypothetical protein